MPALWRDR